MTVTSARPALIGSRIKKRIRHLGGLGRLARFPRGKQRRWAPPVERQRRCFARGAAALSAGHPPLLLSREQLLHGAFGGKSDRVEHHWVYPSYLGLEQLTDRAHGKAEALAASGLAPDHVDEPADDSRDVFCFGEGKLEGYYGHDVLERTLA